MSENLEKLREAGIAHPNHEFTDEHIQKINQLTTEEIDALVSARTKLGEDLIRVTSDDGDDDIHPNTVAI